MEANPHAFEILRKRDRKCWFANACVSSNLRTMNFTVAGGVTTADAIMSASKRARIKEDIETFKNSMPMWEHSGETVTVRCRALQSMLRELGTRHIDYFSLDVEGSEMLMLKSLDWDKLSIAVFTIEVRQCAVFVIARLHGGLCPNKL